MFVLFWDFFIKFKRINVARYLTVSLRGPVLILRRGAEGQVTTFTPGSNTKLSTTAANTYTIATMINLNPKFYSVTSLEKGIPIFLEAVTKNITTYPSLRCK